MTQGKYVELSVAQRTDVWRRWKAGESLHTIGRARPLQAAYLHSLSCWRITVELFRRVCRRSVLALTVVEREDISRGSLSGSSLRDVIAKRLERASVDGEPGGGSAMVRPSRVSSQWTRNSERADSTFARPQAVAFWPSMWSCRRVWLLVN